MPRTTKKDEERERRIRDEIIVDAYGPIEQAIGWYSYLAAQLHFPFTARCMAERATSPLREGDEVDVIGMAPEEDCEHQMLVDRCWKRRPLAVPLAPLQALTADEDTQEAIADWHDWVGQGYEL